MTPALGRDFRAEEETDGRHRVVLLSDGSWRRRFGADPAVVGRTIAFNGNAFEIVGVLPVTSGGRPVQTSWCHSRSMITIERSEPPIFST